MKSLIAGLVFLTALTTVAQTRQKVTLELGSVTVWLGMPKADVLSACAAAGYRATEVKDNGDVFISITTGTARSDQVYAVKVRGGRVIYADREWYSSERDAWESVLGALATLDGKNCLLSHQPVNKPESQMNRVFLLCGPRSVLITNGKRNGVAVSDVWERIGTID
jgi:hypothetical protein